MQTGEQVIEPTWLERLGWMLAAAAVSGFGAWLWASFRKADKTDIAAIRQEIEKRFSEFELRVVEPIRRQNSQFERRVETIHNDIAEVKSLLIELRTKMEMHGK